MSDVFFKSLEVLPLKRVDLKTLRTAWLRSHPEQLETPDRDRLMLVSLEQGAAMGILRLPSQKSYERFGRPPMPSFITLVRQSKEQDTFEYSKVSWAPEMGFWTSLSSQELATALKINDWIIGRRGAFLQVPLRERSLEIFGDEKFLDSRVRGHALFGGKLPLSSIGARRVEHPLAYRPADVVGKPVLLVENHHTFWSLGEWNESAKAYSAIVYGSGKTIAASGLALIEVMRERESPWAEYFGDIDPEGVEIPLLFNQKNSQQLVPCIGLYERLLAVGRRKGGVCTTKFDTARTSLWLPTLSAQIIELWESGNWLPQEGLGLEQLLDYKS